LQALRASLFALALMSCLAPTPAQAQILERPGSVLASPSLAPGFNPFVRNQGFVPSALAPGMEPSLRSFLLAPTINYERGGVNYTFVPATMHTAPATLIFPNGTVQLRTYQGFENYQPRGVNVRTYYPTYQR
jgi:hypothetical protein